MRSRTITCACLLGSLWLPGCFVPEQQYEKAVHSLRAEQAAHRQTTKTLHDVQKKLAEIHEVLDREKKDLEARQSELAQSKLEFDVASTERADAVRMVDQLRGELARVGDHLRQFSDQKSELASALQAAQGRAEELRRLEDDFTRKALLVRDLTHALHAEMVGGTAALSAENGEIHVRLEKRAYFDDTVLLPDSTGTLKRLAKAIAPVARARVEVTEHPRDSSYKHEDVIVRLQSLADVLSEAGMPFERVTLALPKERAAIEPVTGKYVEDPDVDVTEAKPAEAAQALKPAAPAKAPEKFTGSWLDGPGSIELTIRCATPPEPASPSASKAPSAKPLEARNRPPAVDEDLLARDERRFDEEDDR